MATELSGGLSPTEAFAIVGVTGVAAQWLAWRFRLPAIVLMLTGGLVLGPVTGIFIPDRDIGALVAPMISLAVAIILFEGGLTLSVKKLADARPAVRRLVYIGAPLGWAVSSLVLMFAVGLSWESSIVFGGIMIVTGPTVIAPLLRQAKLTARPAQVLQWEGIVNDPIGALVAVLALGVVVVFHSDLPAGKAFFEFGLGLGFAFALGAAGGWFLAQAFRHNWVPEFMKVPVLFVLVLGVFAIADSILHESGLLAVTIMGLVIANADLPSYHELHRFKEHATILLVSGVFILLAAGIETEALAQLTWWRTALFVVLVIGVARPLTVMASLIGSNLPMKERWLIALTGPRGVVLVAVSGVFAERLVATGVADGAEIAPLAFVLVLATVVLHGFTLKPVAKWLGLTSGDTPALMIVGGSLFATGLAAALKKAGATVLIADPNRDHLRTARIAGLPTFYGDILGEAAEHNVEFIAYSAVLAASDNDAYNTLVATDLAPEFGRESIWQLARHREERPNHALPSQLGGQTITGNRTLSQYLDLLADGWEFRTTRLTEEYTLEEWRKARPGAIPIIISDPRNGMIFVADQEEMEGRPDMRLVSLIPPELAEELRSGAENRKTEKVKEVARDQADAVKEKNDDSSTQAKG